MKIQWPISDPDPDPDPFHRVIDDIATIATINQGIARVRNEAVRGQLMQPPNQPSRLLHTNFHQKSRSATV